MYAGMSPPILVLIQRLPCSPHVCGDEPKLAVAKWWERLVVPMCVGMSPWVKAKAKLTKCNPHVCGDEPCSPAILTVLNQ